MSLALACLARHKGSMWQVLKMAAARPLLSLPCFRVGYADSLTFFGVHRMAASESHLAVMGGTGKYLNAKGHALVKTIPATNQHNTDGVDTVLQFTVYLTY
ncbi:dirigent protein 25 [Prunus yedoensis var. nudiflora]|uniref:Dirigent protein n=1 Tax=Prunus yedoensis var. nudiflora TaxID=2094558 RepID=A0A314ZNN3_PRUYE|nr:dirigent protein 25 [Prunus yedoensis var. nudiflora]